MLTAVTRFAFRNPHISLAVARSVAAANNFLRWFMMALAAWSAKKVFDSTITPFTNWFFAKWSQKATELAQSMGVPQTI